MRNDYRTYNYYDNEPLVPRVTQIQEYLDKKLGNIHIEFDTKDITDKIDKVDKDVTDTISTISSAISTVTEDIKNSVKDEISDAKGEIIDAIDEASPCLCNLATKQDVTNAKTDIIKQIETSETNIKTEIEEKFSDLNEIVSKL